MKHKEHRAVKLATPTSDPIFHFLDSSQTDFVIWMGAEGYSGRYKISKRGLQKWQHSILNPARGSGCTSLEILWFSVFWLNLGENYCCYILKKKVLPFYAHGLSVYTGTTIKPQVVSIYHIPWPLCEGGGEGGGAGMRSCTKINEGWSCSVYYYSVKNWKLNDYDIVGRGRVIP